jgi:GntR family transcriptional regulator / MocR family aminotransferase
MANQFADLMAQAEIRLDRSTGTLREQLYFQLRSAVLAGRLLPRTPLPSTRDLASALGVARSTVVEALEQLKAEGYLETRQGAATRVAALERTVLGAGATPRAADGLRTREASIAALPQEQRSQWRNDDPPRPVTLRAFRPGLPDIRAFPAREWATHLARRARHPTSHDLSYASYLGVMSLREQILGHVRLTRHVQARPEQLIVLPSAQAAFDLVAQLVLEPGDTAWVEDPGYPGIAAVLRGHRARVTPVPVDEQGLRLVEQAGKPRLVYVTPSHQYPTGVTMSLPRRLELLALARRVGAAIVEDDYDSEFQYRGQPTASLQGLDRHGCVHYVGTFSKSLAPGLHVAYLIVPERFVELAHTVATARGLTVPVHVQLALADFLEAGGLRRHVRAMNAEYGSRMATLVEVLRADGLLTVPAGAGGLQLCVGLPGSLADTGAVAALQSVGIAAAPISPLCMGVRHHGLLLGIGLPQGPEVRTAAKTLCQLLHRLHHS